MCVFVCTKQFIILRISLEAIWHPGKQGCKSELLRAPLQTSTLRNIDDIRGQTLVASQMLYFSKKTLNVNFPKSLFTYIMLHLTHKKVIMLVNWKNAFWLRFTWRLLHSYHTIGYLIKCNILFFPSIWQLSVVSAFCVRKFVFIM